MEVMAVTLYNGNEAMGKANISLQRLWKDTQLSTETVEKSTSHRYTGLAWPVYRDG